MTNDNLFINIQKYRPRESLNPRENFFTEIFAFILNKDRELVSKFLKLIDLSNEINDIKVNTQVVHSPNGTVDVELIINKSTHILIENKLDSTINEYEEEVNGEITVNNQLEKYLEIQGNGEVYHVVLLTQHPETVDGKIKSRLQGHIFWKNIYTLLEKYSSRDKNIDFLIKQFIGLMKEENMNPYVEITKEMAEGYELVPNVFKLFDEVFNELKKENKIQIGKQAFTQEFFGKYFLLNNIEFEMTYATNKFRLWIRKPKSLTSEQKEKFENKGFIEESGINKGWFQVPFEIGPEFFEKNAKEQIKILTEFYTKYFNKAKEIIHGG